jgi:1-acyl-sn-glycerol-3-phosphate acyltransferase
LPQGIIGLERVYFGGVDAALLYRISQLIVRLLLLLTRYRVRGRDNIPSQGPLIVVANHLNLIDPPLLGFSLGRRAMFMAKEELFRSKPASYFMGSLGAFPVSKGRLDRKALRRAMQVLADGLVLVIFPEGMRSRGGRLGAAFPGVALIAVRSGVPIIPVGITGTKKLKGVSWLWRRPEVIVNIGLPFSLPPAGSKLTKVELLRLTDVIMGRIAELLPVEYRGHYGGRD